MEAQYFIDTCNDKGPSDKSFKLLASLREPTLIVHPHRQDELIDWIRSGAK